MKEEIKIEKRGGWEYYHSCWGGKSGWEYSPKHYVVYIPLEPTKKEIKKGSWTCAIPFSFIKKEDAEEFKMFLEKYFSKNQMKILQKKIKQIYKQEEMSG